VPIVFASASALSQPHWDWDTSFFGRYLAIPLLVLALCSCLAGVFFTSLSLGGRFALSAAVLIAFAGIVVGSVILCVVFFGAPFH